jgi:hypothetical protein
VLYDRVLILATPALIIAVGELACLVRERVRWISAAAATAMIFGPVLTYSVISNGEFVRVREADVRRFIEQLVHHTGEIRVISDVHDYGPMADLHELFLLEKLEELSLRPEFVNFYIAFNLRSDCYIKPDADRRERYRLDPLFRLPAQGLDQDGLGRRFISLTALEPCRFGTRFDDIKVYPASRLLQDLRIRVADRTCSRSHIGGTQPQNSLR